MWVFVLPHLLQLPSSSNIAETLTVRHLLNTLTQNYSAGQQPQSPSPPPSSSSSPSPLPSQARTQVHTSYIRLEGVDSIGHVRSPVSQYCMYMHQLSIYSMSVLHVYIYMHQVSIHSMCKHLGLRQSPPLCMQIAFV